MDGRHPSLLRLGKQLRRFRLAKDQMTQSHLARLVGCRDSTISGIETGQARPSRDLIVALDNALETYGAMVEMFEMIKWNDYPVQSFALRTEAESMATIVREYELGVVPGLLQTPEYARALLMAGRPTDTPEQIENLVNSRIERQAIFTRDSPRPPRLKVIMDESALRRQIGGSEVHAAQLDHLLEAAERRAVVVQVIPFATGAHAGLVSSFSILSFHDAPDIAYSEDQASGHLHERPELVSVLFEAFEALQLYTLTAVSSLQLIQKVREETMSNLQSVDWRKSNHSGGNGGNCVELAVVEDVEAAHSS